MDYKNLKIGLEIHQQLDGKKLFCSCPCIIKDENPDFKLKRYLRVSASELGKTDQAALYESQKRKYFIYEGYNDTNCLVEIDESPPEELNKKALEIAIQISHLLKASIVDQIQFMRKIVIDGSNVSGFQRTALISTGGSIETSEGKIKISSVCLEEEAAKKLEDTKEFRRYNISRLGIPLIEIATEPDIKSALGAKEAAEKIGMILRSLEGIKRGIGTIRQDINLSIDGHPKVEIKGFQDLKSIPKVVEYEIKRQVNSKEKKSEVRKAEPDFTTSFLRPMPGASRMYPETDIPVIYLNNKLLNKIKIPELISAKVENLEELYDLQSDLAREIIKKSINFEHFVNQYRNLNANIIARILIEVPKEIKSRMNLDISKLTEDNFHEVLELINDGKINKNSAIDILSELIINGKIDVKKYELTPEMELEKEIIKIIKENKHLSFNAVMGEAMKKFKGKADPKNISEIVKRFKK